MFSLEVFHCVYIGRKEGVALFNDALNTFYLVIWHRTYCKGPLYMHHCTDRIAHSTTFVKSVMGHWLEQDIAQWVHHEGSIRQPIAP